MKKTAFIEKVINPRLIPAGIIDLQLCQMADVDFGNLSITLFMERYEAPSTGSYLSEPDLSIGFSTHQSSQEPGNIKSAGCQLMPPGYIPVRNGKLPASRTLCLLNPPG